MNKTTLLCLFFISLCVADDLKTTLSSQFITFNKIEDLYFLLYEAMLAGIVTKEGSFSPTLFVETVKTLPELYALAKNHGIIVLDDQFSSGGLWNYVKSDLALYNMLCRCELINALGTFDQDKLAELLTRYNPTTKQLDPIPNTTYDERKQQTNEDRAKPITMPDDSFSLGTVEEVYKLVLQAYRVGIFDKDGNFIESAFSKLLSEEDYIMRMFKQAKMIDDDLKIDYAAVAMFVDTRTNLSALLADAGIYKNGNYSTKAISDIIFRYNEQTGKLDLQPVLPVVDQIEQTEEQKKESLEKQKQIDAGMHGLTLSQLVTNLFEDPVTYLRDFLVFLRKNVVFSPEGDFDSFVAYDLFAPEPTLANMINKYKIYNETVFSTTNLANLVNSNAQLKAASATLGIFLNGYYSQDALTAVVESYPSPYEEPALPFTLLNPLSAQTTEDVMKLISYFYSLKVVDKEGIFDITMLQNAMDANEVLKQNILATGILQNNVVSIPKLRMTIVKYPLFRMALCKLGILDSIGELDRTALVRAIVRAINEEKPKASVPVVAKVNKTYITSLRGKIDHSGAKSATLSTTVSNFTNNISPNPKNYRPVAIAFIVIGAIVIFALLIAGTVFAVRKCRKGNGNDYSRV